MKKWAYYNESDPFAAAWLRNLIAAGHIAPGEVDERKIQDVEAFEISGFLQCHFFAGVGVWSHALRRAGWADDGREIWTGSCPCQPFSAAGRQKGFDDERHLWPVWFRLIDQCRPPSIIGEQVASALQWLDLVSADLEGAGYAFGASDLCAAGFGQPGIGGFHIRQRLYFVAMAHADSAGWRQAGRDPAGRGAVGGVANSNLANSTEIGAGDDPFDRERAPVGRRAEQPSGLGAGSRISRGDNRDGRGAVGFTRDVAELDRPDAPDDGGMADADRRQRDGLAIVAGYERDGQDTGRSQERGESQPCGDHDRTDAPDDGRPIADWLFCRDGKWRPVEPGTFPLADAAPARVGRLRAYGNALDAETATQFCGAVKEIADAVRPLADYDL